MCRDEFTALETAYMLLDRLSDCGLDGASEAAERLLNVIDAAARGQRGDDEAGDRSKDRSH